MKNKMKLWRKHNSTKFVRDNPKYKLVTKQERRTRFTSEHKVPSQLLLKLMHRFYLENVLV